MKIKNMKNLKNRDLEQTKEQLIGLRKVASEESTNVMNTLLREELGGDAQEFYDYDKKILRVKLKDVKEISKIKKVSSISLIPKWDFARNGLYVTRLDIESTSGIPPDSDFLPDDRRALGVEIKLIPLGR